MNLGIMLNRVAGFFKENTAFECAGKTRTFAEIHENANRFANGLASLGVAKGDRVAIVADNSVEYVEVDFGLYKSGIVRVAINQMLSANEIAYLIEDSGSSVVVTSPHMLNAISAIKPQLPDVKHYICISEAPSDMIEYHKFIEGQSSAIPDVQIDEDDLAQLFYTGGTTGVPKGAMHSHGSLMSVLMNLQSEYWQLNQNDVVLTGGPLAHANGFRTIVCYFEGARMIIPEGFVPEQVLNTIEKEKVTVLSTVPTTLVRLCDYPDIKKYNLDSLRLITYGAAPMPTEKLREALKTFGNRLAQSYGQAEALMAITILPKEAHVLDGTEEETQRLASAGRPYPMNQVRIVNDQGKDVQPDGEVGEVIVKGGITMKGYWNKPEATAETLKDGWIYTGDLAKIDRRGYIYLVDRKKDIIISGGENIYAREVEDVLNTHPAIAEAAVIGVPDEAWGEAVKAVVSLKPGTTATDEELIQYCKERMASFKKPKSVDFVAELPKTGIGKISKKDLKARYWAGQERMIH